jgi:predicted DCC family thiol-disulfide oxidoreductase YuxK
VCGLCNRLNQFVIARDRARLFRFAPLQGATARAVLGRHGKDAADLDTFWVVIDFETSEEQVLGRAQGILFALGLLPGLWRLAPVLAVIPRPFLDLAYVLVASVRYRLFGRHDACPLPTADARDRFLDVGEQPRTRRIVWPRTQADAELHPLPGRRSDGPGPLAPPWAAPPPPSRG